MDRGEGRKPQRIHAGSSFIELRSPVAIIKEQGTGEFSQCKEKYDPGEAFCKFDTAGKNWKNICHFRKSHDPASEKNPGEQSV